MEQGGEHSGGFTIVETLIVLSVSAILALSALLLVNGRQNKTEFQTAINNLQQQVQQIINETQSGYYPNNNTFTCTTTSGIPDIRSGSADQGTNNDCIFVGKALSFGDSDGGGSLKSDQIMIYPLVANRQNSTGAEVTGYNSSEAKIVPVTKGAVPPLSSFPADSSIHTLISDALGGGLSFKSAVYTPVGNFAAPHIAVFGILTSLASVGTAGLNSGAQQFALYGFPGTNWGGANSDSPATVADNIYHNQSAIQPLTSISLCFDSGTTNQSGSLIIGDPANGGLGVTLQIHDGTCP